MDVALYWPSGEFVGYYPEDVIRARVKKREVTPIPSRHGKQRKAVLRDTAFSEDLVSYGNTDGNGDAGDAKPHYRETLFTGALCVVKKYRSGRLMKWRNPDPTNPKRTYDRFSQRPIQHEVCRQRRVSALAPPLRNS